MTHSNGFIIRISQIKCFSLLILNLDVIVIFVIVYRYLMISFRYYLNAYFFEVFKVLSVQYMWYIRSNFVSNLILIYHLACMHEMLYIIFVFE